MSRTAAMLCLLAAMAMTGANVPLAKAIVRQAPAEALLPVRFGVAVIVLAVMAPLEPGPRLRDLGPRDWGAVAVLGLVGSVAFTWLVLAGVARTSGTDAGIITAVLPAVVAGVGLATGQRPRAGEAVMIALAVAGVALIQVQAVDGGAVAATADGAGDRLVGNLLIGLAVFCEAAFVVVARGISTRLKPLRLSLAVALVSLAACLPPSAGSLVRFEADRVDPGVWLLLGWYIMTASIACTALWYRGVAHVEAWAAGLATAAVPVSALAVSVALLGERVSLPQAAGAVLVIAAIAAGTMSRRGASRLRRAGAGGIVDGANRKRTMP